ncbi:MAG: EAL domain-containing protein [Lachnospiraceae bacterium]|nr:EAL domain-containing protein [Lachnospiraceae bacterium]
MILGSYHINSTYEMVSLWLLLILALFFVFRKQIVDEQNKMYFKIYLISLANVLLSVILAAFSVPTSFLSAGRPMLLDEKIYRALLFLYCGTMTALPMYVTNYGRMIVDVKDPNRDKMISLYSRIWFFVALVVFSYCSLTGLFTEVIYEDGEAALMNITGIYFVVYRIFLVIHILMVAASYLKPKGKKDFVYIKLYLIVGIMLACILIMSLPNPELNLFGFATALLCWIIYILYENPAKYIDKQTSLLYRQALYVDCLKNKQRKNKFYVYLFSIDRFNKFNENYGSDAGNAVLSVLSNKLINRLRTNKVYRYSGSVFAIIIRGSEDLDEVKNTLLDIAGENVIVGSTIYEVSLFVARVPGEMMDANEFANWNLLENICADMTRSKEVRYTEYDSKFVDTIKRKDAIVTGLNNAIMYHKMELAYQPIFSVFEQRFVSLEALARLYVDDYGRISPDEFISLAEKNDMIIQLGYVIIEEVCRFIVDTKLREKGVQLVQINMSTIQGMQEGFAKRALEIIDTYDVPHEMLAFELTESEAILAGDILAKNMKELTDAGIIFALDDYGSGYSNINYVIEMPFKLIKLDKYFVWAAFEDENSKILLEHTIKMFKKLHLEIIAEGIENESQVEKISRVGADYIQGYYFSKPVTGRELEAKLSGNRKRELARTRQAEEEKFLTEDEGKIIINTAKKDLTHVIAICTANMQQQIEGGYVTRLATIARENGYFVEIYNSVFGNLSESDSEEQGQASVYNLINYDEVDFIIILPRVIKSASIVERVVTNARRKNVPVILIDEEMEGCYSVKYDYVGGFRKICSHIMIDHGCSKVNFIGGPKDDTSAQERMTAFKEMLASRCIPYEESRIGYGDFWEGPAREVTKGFLNVNKLDELPDAIICANDIMAIAAIGVISNTVIEGRRLSVPEDIIVTGFDGIEMEKYHSPRLTTAIQDIETAARQTFNIVSKVLSGEPCKQKVLIPHLFVPSQSCGCEPKTIIATNEMQSELYSRLASQEIYENEMYKLLSVISDNDSLEECLAKLPHYIKMIGCDYFAIYFIERFINDVRGIETEAGSFKNASTATGKKMIRMMEGYCSRDDFEVKEAPIGNNEILLDLIAKAGDTRKIMFYPLHFQNDEIGYIAMSYWHQVINFKRANSFSSNIGNALMMMRNQVRIKTTNSMLRQSNVEMEKIYDRDALTGLYNRHGFDKRFRAVLKESIMADPWLLLASIDMDELKYINDTFLHYEGDNALKTVGKCMEEVGGRDAICARFGGDEFVMAIIMPYAENVREEFSQKLINWMDNYNEHSRKPYKWHISFGLTFEKCNKDTSNFAERLEEADNLMYIWKNKAKEERRKNGTYHGRD